MADEVKLDVDAIAPTSAGLEAVARRRVGDIIKEWARILSVWGSDGTHGQHGEPVQETYSLSDLAVACYVQGARDTTAVAASRAPDPDVLRELERVEKDIALNEKHMWERKRNDTLTEGERALAFGQADNNAYWADAIACVRRKLGGE